MPYPHRSFFVQKLNPFQTYQSFICRKTLGNVASPIFNLDQTHNNKRPERLGKGKIT